MQTQGKLPDPWKESERLEAEVERLRAALRAILAIEDDCYSGDWAEIEEARLIARDALSNQSL